MTANFFIWLVVIHSIMGIIGAFFLFKDTGRLNGARFWFNVFFTGTGIYLLIN